MDNYWDGNLYKNNSRLQRYFGTMVIDKYIVQNEFDSKLGLDIGCGDGYLTNELQKKLRCKMHGIDISPKMIVVAEEYKNDDLSFAEKNILIMDSNNKYSFVTSFFCLQWITDQEKAYHNIHKLLIEGGKGYLLISPKKLSDKPNYDSVVKKLITNETYAEYFSDFCIERTDLTKEGVQNNIEQSGLIVDEMIEISEPFLFENKKELSNFFRCIVTKCLVIKDNAKNMKEELIDRLCDDVVLELIEKKSFTMLDDGKIESKQVILFIILHK